MEKQKRRKTIRNYSLLLLVVVFLISFSVVNSPNDGELNDYEIYTPEIVVNESNQTAGTDEDSQDKDVELILSSMIIFFIICMLSITIGYISKLFNTREYC